MKITQFLNAFLGVVSPFVTMIRDLLGYFETAEASSGPQQWNLVLGDGPDKLEMNLDHFRRSIAKVERSAAECRMVPILDKHGLFELRKAFYRLRPASVGEFDQTEPKNKSPELTKWLDSYEAGIYLPLPAEVLVALRDPGPAGDVAALLIEISTAIFAIAKTKAELEMKGQFQDGSADFWSPRGLWFFEIDYWIRGRVLDLATWVEASAADRRGVNEELEHRFEGIPRRHSRINVTLNELEEILSLPSWQRRYELYSAWVLTLMLKALEGHSIKLHHDEGRIEFAFRETLMATILTKSPSLEVYAERRTAADSLTGHGRVRGVQPDYSVWINTRKECVLAVECKQYKRSSTTNFGEALNDYASALGRAKIVLANYGPVNAAVLDAVVPDRRLRCWAIGQVQPENPSACEKFREAVRGAIGEPETWLRRHYAETDAKSMALAVDVSGSMQSIIGGASGLAAIHELILAHNISRVAAIDEKLVAEGPVNDVERIIGTKGSGGTNLSATIAELLEQYPTVLVLTDEDGKHGLNGVSIRQLELPRIDNTSAVLLEVGRQPT